MQDLILISDRIEATFFKETDPGIKPVLIYSTGKVTFCRTKKVTSTLCRYRTYLGLCFYSCCDCIFCWQVQSHVLDDVFYSDRTVVVAAPTGNI